MSLVFIREAVPLSADCNRFELGKINSTGFSDENQKKKNSVA